MKLQHQQQMPVGKCGVRCRWAEVVLRRELCRPLPIRISACRGILRAVNIERRVKSLNEPPGVWAMAPVSTLSLRPHGR